MTEQREREPVTFVVPVYNEEGILRSAIVDLHAQAETLRRPFEIIISENGSTDNTVAIARSLSARFAGVRMLTHSAPDYGTALRRGILEARDGVVICEEIDLCDIEFARTATDLIGRGQATFVVGSKLIAGARDRRPLYRNIASRGYNALLRHTLGFRGTDTHGLKAFSRRAVVPIVERCEVGADVFASELVIRAHRAGLKVVEVPVMLAEKRPPSIGLFRRVPRVLRDLSQLYWSIGRRP